MKLNFGRNDAQFLQPKPEQKAQWESTLQRLIASQSGNLGFVTPQNCMQSPTVHAVVTAVSRRMGQTPVHVYRKTMDSRGRVAKEAMPNHSVSLLLNSPNKWQSRYDFWQDAASAFLRFGNFYAYKTQGNQGPIRELLPLDPGNVEPEQDPRTWEVRYRLTQDRATTSTEPFGKILHARSTSRNFVKGDSPVNDCSTAIALEILAERFGANFFKNGALPFLILSYMDGTAGFETEQQEKEFLDQVKEAYGGNKQLSAMLMPKGINKPDTLSIKNDEAQFLETRKLQRTIIAGAFGVPPHLVGDLERATFNNVEQQDKDFTQNVVLPVAKAFEAAMERDLLTQKDRNEGLIIRFNLDSILRASFKDRQEGLQIQRQNGVINANEWREHEGMNPRQDAEGEDYIHPGNMVVDGEEPDETDINSFPGSQEPQQ